MAEGRYCRVKSKFWTDERVQNWSDEEKLLSLYLLSSPHSNMLGCYVLPREYICADLGWTLKDLGKAFGKLLSEGFFSYDESTRLILLPNYLKHTPITNGNQVIAAIKQLAELPKSPLLSGLKDLVEDLGKDLPKNYLKPLAKAIGNNVSVSVSVEVSVSEEESPKSEPSDAPLFPVDSLPMRLAVHLKDCILENNPKPKSKPNPETWAVDIDKMIRLDKLDPDEIGAVIDWCQGDEFWRANILSGYKLRDKWDTLYLQAKPHLEEAARERRHDELERKRNERQ